MDLYLLGIRWQRPAVAPNDSQFLIVFYTGADPVHKVYIAIPPNSISLYYFTIKGLAVPPTSAI